MSNNIKHRMHDVHVVWKHIRCVCMTNALRIFFTHHPVHYKWIAAVYI